MIAGSTPVISIRLNLRRKTVAKKLMLYEALELREEFNWRSKMMKALLPESNRHLIMGRDHDATPVERFDVKECRDIINTLEIKKRKLNDAIQRANFNHEVDVLGEKMSLYEALADRKGVTQRIPELEGIIQQSIYILTFHKEDRDIRREPDVDYGWCRDELEKNVLRLRALNRAIRKSSYEVEVNFFDE
jgi:hypothetical protein